MKPTQRTAMATLVVGLALAIAGCSLISSPDGYRVGGAAGGGFAAEPSEKTNRNGPTGNSVTVPEHR
jgi:hypothetical protein